MHQAHPPPQIAPLVLASPVSSYVVSSLILVFPFSAPLPLTGLLLPPQIRLLAHSTSVLPSWVHPSSAPFTGIRLSQTDL